MSYTQPRLCHYNFDLSKQWCVYFYVRDDTTGVKIQKQFRSGINRFKTKEQRIAKADAVILFWKNNLSKGWSPFKQSTQLEKIEKLSFIQAVDFALAQCTVAKKTKLGYVSSANFFKYASAKLGISNVSIDLIRRSHIKMMLQYIKEKRKWSNTAYNHNLGYFKSVLGRLIEWDILEFNPAEKIKSLPVAETQKFVPYTTEEKSKIREYLYLHHYRFFVYFQILYQTGIRPKELLALKIKYLNFEERTISILPNLEAENSKTKSIRIVPINNQLLPYVRELKLNEYSKELFIFGSPYEAGKGNKGSAAGKLTGAMHPDYFKPSLVQIKRDTVTKFWKKIIIDKLGIKKYLYAAKATGADDKILAGISLESLREMYGHSSSKMTEKYVSVLKKLHMKEIIEKSPEF